MIESDMGREKIEVVEECLKLAPEGIYLEVGTRMGGTALFAMQEPKSRVVISVDPYGDRPFRDMEGDYSKYKFPNTMYTDTMQQLFEYAKEYKKTFIPYKMTSQDFTQNSFGIWLDGEESKNTEVEYSYVLLDGEHTNEAVQQEIDFFAPRMKKGGVLLVDNTDWLTLPFSDWNVSRYDMSYKIF